MKLFRKAEIRLDQDEWFDVRAEVEGSNQRARDGWFRMQVRRVEGWEFFRYASLDDQIMVAGRRYKPDGSFSSIEARANLEPSRLPDPVREALNQMTEAFR